PITTTLSLNLSWRLFKSGIERRHGAHQVAQKSTSRNLPAVAGFSVSHFSVSRTGAGLFRNEAAAIVCGELSCPAFEELVVWSDPGACPALAGGFVCLRAAM